MKCITKLDKKNASSKNKDVKNASLKSNDVCKYCS